MKGFGWGSGRRRCKIGMPCGETCISRRLKCVLDLPKMVAKVVPKAVSAIKGRFGRKKAAEPPIAAAPPLATPPAKTTSGPKGPKGPKDLPTKGPKKQPVPEQIGQPQVAPKGQPAPAVSTAKPTEKPSLLSRARELPGKVSGKLREAATSIANRFGIGKPKERPEPGQAASGKPTPATREEKRVEALGKASKLRAGFDKGQLDISPDPRDTNNRYSKERERLIRVYREVEKAKTRVANSNLSDATKGKLLADLDKASKDAKANLAQAAKMEKLSWSQSLKAYMKNPAVREEDKKILSALIRVRSPFLSAQFEARSQGQSDKEFRDFFDKKPGAKPPESIPGVKELVKTPPKGKSEKPVPPPPKPIPPTPKPPSELPPSGGRGGGRGGGYGGYGGGGGGGRERPYSKVEESVASTVRKIVEAIARIFSKLTGRDGDTDAIEKNARRLARLLPKEQRAKMEKLLDKKFPKKPSIPDKGPKDAAELAQAAGKIMAKYDKSLRSAASVARRGATLLNELTTRIEQAPDDATKNRLTAAYNRAYGRYASASVKLDAIMDNIRGDMLKTSLTNDEVNGLVRGVRFNLQDRAGAGQARGQVREFVRMFNGLGFSEVAGEGKNGVGRSVNSITVQNGLDRAHAEPSKGRITLRPGSGFSNKQDNFHEMAHILEAQRPWLRGMLEQWRDSRAFSREDISNYLTGANGKPMSASGYVVGANGQQIPLVRLNKLLGDMYQRDELAVADNFLNPYMGKVYRHGMGTEILSVAVQHFADPAKMSQLYLAHPELFETVVGLAAP